MLSGCFFGFSTCSSSSAGRGTACRLVVGLQHIINRLREEPQLCVCVFIRDDSSTQWNKDTVNHNQTGVCGLWGRGIGDLRRLGEEPVCPECSERCQCGTLKVNGRG